MSAARETPVALVTGSKGGIGRATVAKLAAGGYHVIGADRTFRTCMPRTKRNLMVDLADAPAIDVMVAEALGTFGRLDVLVNAAGIQLQKLVVDTTPEEWDRIQTVNLQGPFLTCRAVAPHMMRTGCGRIVNLVTRLGFGNPYSSAYMAAKSGLWSFTQCLVVEFASYGITVNAVASGHVGPGTGMEQAFRDKAARLGLTWKKLEAEVLRSVPLGRWCRPDDVAAAVAYLVSPEAAFVTAEYLDVTGGFVGYATTPPRMAE